MQTEENKVVELKENEKLLQFYGNQCKIVTTCLTNYVEQTDYQYIEPLPGQYDKYNPRHQKPKESNWVDRMIDILADPRSNVEFDGKSGKYYE